MRHVLKRPKNTSKGVPVDLVFEKNQKEKNISEKKFPKKVLYVIAWKVTGKQPKQQLRFR